MASSWSQTGNQKTSLGIVIFGDCSVCWWKISWSLTGGSLKREGRYRPIPSPERLYEASERYGPLLAQFALEAVEKRQPVGRGECWDIANSGLEYAATQLPPGEKPFPSIGRTHGVLIYYGRAGKDAVGLWKGGEEEYVRPGDIVEWRTVTIREVGMQPGAYAILGAPDVSSSPSRALLTRVAHGNHHLGRLALVDAVCRRRIGGRRRLPHRCAREPRCRRAVAGSPPQARQLRPDDHDGRRGVDLPARFARRAAQDGG